MNTLISFSLVLHMILLGIYLGHRAQAITPRLIGAVFAWMVIFHAGAGVFLSHNLEIVDPRGGS